MRILYVDIDSCRPDHLGCYGYGRPTSPVLDELAEGGALFLDCHASDTPCLPSRAALFSGRFGITNGVTCHDGPASQLRYPGRGHFHDPERPMWMRALQQAGWETVCFSGFGQRHLAWWFSAGFTQFFGNRLPGGVESAEEVNGQVVPWLRDHGAKDDWFLHVNYWDVHTPYAAPRAHQDRVASGPGPSFPDEEAVARDAHGYYGPRTARDWWHDEPGWRNPQTDQTALMPEGNPVDFESYTGFLNGYDAGISYVDEQVGVLLGELERLGIREETAVIVSADHGESIGELGMYFEHGNCSEGTTRVPLIVQWPGAMRQGGVFDGLLYQLDLAPTVLDLLGIEPPPGWDGESVADAVRGTRELVGRDHLVLGTGIYSFQRAVRTRRHRLIRTLHPGLYPYDPLYLFDTAADRNQERNVAADHPEVVSEMDHLLLEWTYRHTTGPAGVRDPFQEQLRAGVSPDLYCARQTIEQRLIDLGRDDQLADLRRRRDVAPPPQPR